MVNKSKITGTRFESDIVNYLKPYFPQIERRALAGALDKGDILGIPNWVIEAKARTQMSIGTWVGEATVEARNAAVPHWVVIHKKKMHNIKDAYATIELRTWFMLQHGIFALGLPDKTPSSHFITDILDVMHTYYPTSYVQQDYIHGVPQWLILAKNAPEINMKTDSAVVSAQTLKNNLPYWGMIHRRRLHSLLESYFTTSLHLWKELVLAQLAQPKAPKTSTFPEQITSHGESPLR